MAGKIPQIAYIVLAVTSLAITGYILLTPEQSPPAPVSQPELRYDAQFEPEPRSETEPKPEPEIEFKSELEQQPEAELKLELEREPELKLEPMSTSFKGYPVGELTISADRKAYSDGEMILEIPRLNLVSSVMAGTDQVSLRSGVGLFNYAQLPGVYNSNTSLAGHRDIYGMEFYYIDTITDGDLMYLTYQNKKYTYEYMETFVTNDSNWDPIKVRDFACVTLQSCTPIGTARNRIFVVGKLIKTEDAS